MLVWVCVYVCVFLRIVRMGENVWEWYGSCVIYVYKLTFVCNDIPCSISYLIKFFSVLFLIVLLCLFWLKNDQIYPKKNLLINNWLLTYLKKVSIKKDWVGIQKRGSIWWPETIFFWPYGKQFSNKNSLSITMFLKFKHSM